MDKLVYNIDELAFALGFKSVGAIYKHVHRQNWDAVPKPIRLGTKLTWPIDNVKSWLLNKYNANTTEEVKQATAPTPTQKKKRGRPRKTA